jgi:teichuronic acid exporter
MLYVVLTIAITFLDSGFGSALIQKQEPSHVDYSSVFYFNVAIGVAAYMLCFLGAPLIAHFFREPQLVPLTRFLGLSLIINALGMVQGTILEKGLDFKKLAKISFVSLFFSGATAVFLAKQGAGVWSIAIQIIVSCSLRTTLLWFFGGWRPTRDFSMVALKPLYRYGSKLLASSLLETIFQNMYTMVIGRYFRARELGYYTQARNIQEAIVHNLANVVGKVTFPALSKIQHDDVRLKGAFKSILQLLAFLNFPLMLGLLVIARPLIEVVFSAKWLPAVPYIQLMSLSNAIYTIEFTNLGVLRAKGRSDLLLKVEIIKKSMVMAMLLVSLHWGVMGVLAGMVITTYASYFVESYYSSRLIEYSVKEQMVDLAPCALLSIVMAIATYLAGNLFTLPALTMLLVQVPFAIVVYCAGAYLFHLEALGLFEDIIKTHIGYGEKREA